MYYDYYGFRPYVPVAKKLANAKAHAKKKLGNKPPRPIEIEGRKIAKTFWGGAWCDNLESYSDFANRMPRGRTYVRNGSVVHLEIDKGQVTSFVAGSETYRCKIRIDPLNAGLWKTIKKKCAGEIGSVVELLQGKMSKHVLGIVTDKKGGMFPSPKEIHLDCSCPDWADMCKHVAATLYGVGALLDRQPELFFKLRGVDHLELIDESVEIGTGRADSDTLDSGSLEDIFGVELSDSLSGKTAKPKRKKTVKKAVKKTAQKTSAPKKAKPVRKSTKKTVKKAARKTSSRPAPARKVAKKSPAKPRKKSSKKTVK